MTNTIFFGNGINRVAGGDAWIDVLKKISFNKNIPEIGSNTLRYEYIILPMRDKQTVPWTLNGRMLMCGGRFLGRQVSMENDIVKKRLCIELKTQPFNTYYSELAMFNASSYITTNYELLLNKEFEKLGYLQTASTNDSLLYSRDIWKKKNEKVSIWNIHGNWDSPSSIMLGIKDYCDYVSEISYYFKEVSEKKQQSWIDLFFQTDVHIIGFGLEYEETDLWYVLTYRKRKIRQMKDEFNNHIYYYVFKNEYDIGKKSLLEAMDIEIIEVPFFDSYQKSYITLFNILKDKIGIRQRFQNSSPF